MVSEKKMINEIVDDDEDDKDGDKGGRRIIPIALGLSAGGLKTTRPGMRNMILFFCLNNYKRNERVPNFK